MCVRDLQERQNTINIDTLARPGVLHNSIDGFSLKFAKTPKSVRFNESLVVDVRERPRTMQCDKAALFYGREDYKRFRYEYRIYRQCKNEIQTDSFKDFSLDTIQYTFSSINKVVNGITENVLSVVDLSPISNDDELYAALHQYV